MSYRSQIPRLSERTSVSAIFRALMLVAITCTVATPLLSFAQESLRSPIPFHGRVAPTPEESRPYWPPLGTYDARLPNIVLILLDDAGFADAGSFGGLVDTPALDALAAHGLRYNRFHATAVCSPTRAALLSGRNHHKVGFGTISEAPSGFPGYNTIWGRNAASIAEVLRQNGYSTSAFGKWHNTPTWEVSPIGPFDRWPTGMGFEYFFGFMVGETSQWETPLYRNTEPVSTPDGLKQDHLTSEIATDAIRWIHTHESLAPDKPYFLYFAPGATHKPHHVSEDWIRRYRGRFNDGWDILRRKIFVRQKTLGIVPPDTKLTDRPAEVEAWSSLTPAQKQLFAHQMEVYAAFRSQTDFEIGRLLAAVENGPRADNTLIIYIASDNGASGMDGAQGNDDTQAPADSIGTQLDRASELGGLDHLNAYASGWAWMNSTPFKGMKLDAAHLGGIRVPLVISWPSRIKARGEIRQQFTHINSIAATIYEAAAIDLPNVIDGVPQLPLDGPSFLHTFNDPRAKSKHGVQYFENWGNRSIYKDDWMASLRTSRGAATDETSWELYNLERDFSQARNLAKSEPRQLRSLITLFSSEAEKNDVYPIGATWAYLRAPDVPSISGQRTAFTYYPGLPRLPSEAVPDFLRTHRVIAKADVKSLTTEGIIVSYGSRFGGFTLFVKDNHLIYESNARGKKTTVITSDRAIPTGTVELAYEFQADLTQTVSKRPDTVDGTARIYVNGTAAGEARVTQSSAYYGTATFGIGQAFISPVSKSYELPFKFTGALQFVRVVLDETTSISRAPATECARTANRSCATGAAAATPWQ